VAARWVSIAASGSVSLAHGRDLRRCHILYSYRGIKDVLIALSSPQQHTTQPLAHHLPTNTHTRRYKLEQSSNQPRAITSAFVPSCHCQCATTVTAHPFSISVGTAFMVLAVPVLPRDPQLPQYKYVYRCTCQCVFPRSSGVAFAIITSL
jgi:hypothetical protein